MYIDENISVGKCKTIQGVGWVGEGERCFRRGTRQKKLMATVSILVLNWMEGP